MQEVQAERDFDVVEMFLNKQSSNLHSEVVQLHKRAIPHKRVTRASAVRVDTGRKSNMGSICIDLSGETAILKEFYRLKGHRWDKKGGRWLRLRYMGLWESYFLSKGWI